MEPRRIVSDAAQIKECLSSLGKKLSRFLRRPGKSKTVALELLDALGKRSDSEYSSC